MKALTLLCVVALILLVTVDAHKSVKFMKPQSEEEKVDHHLFHHASKHIPKAAREQEHHDQFVNEGHKKPRSYHNHFGPQYPEHHHHVRDNKGSGPHGKSA